MQVYCLLGGYEYEGSSLLGVYASLEDAQAARQDEGASGYDFYYVERREVGAPADYPEAAVSVE